MAETQTRQITASQDYCTTGNNRRPLNTGVSKRLWWRRHSRHQLNRSEAEPVSIDIAAVFTVFLRTFYSMVVLESNILAFYQQKLSRNNVKNIHAGISFQ